MFSAKIIKNCVETQIRNESRAIMLLEMAVNCVIMLFQLYTLWYSQFKRS